MKNYYNTFILLLLLIVLIFIFVITNLNKFDNFDNYYIEGCKTNTYGKSNAKSCTKCKTCDGVKNDQGTVCNSNDNLCYRSGCSSYNEGICKKVKNCSYDGSKYKYRINSVAATDGNVGSQGECGYIYCPSTKYIEDPQTMSSIKKSELESGTLSIDNIRDNYCVTPPQCNDKIRQGFVQATNGQIGALGICTDKWRGCVNNVQYYDDDTNRCESHTDNNITCPTNEFISRSGEAKTESNGGIKKICSSCYGTCNGETVPYYEYNHLSNSYDYINNRICGPSEKCYREACNATSQGACRHATYFQKNSCQNGKPLIGTQEATNTSNGTPGNCTAHPECTGNKYRTKTQWNQSDNKINNCYDFASCNDNTTYLKNQVKASVGNFGNIGFCAKCNGTVVDGECILCNNQNQYLEPLSNICEDCPVVNNGVQALENTTKTNILQCSVTCNTGYKDINTICTKCNQDQYLNGGECVSCDNISNSTHDNDSTAKSHVDQCKIKCDTGFKLNNKSCVKCNKNEYYTSGNQNNQFGLKSGICSACDIPDNGERSNNENDIAKSSEGDCKITCNDGYKYTSQGEGDSNTKTCTICGIGTHEVDGECIDCSIGKYQNETGQTECKFACDDDTLINNSCYKYTNTTKATEQENCYGFRNYAISSTYSNDGYINKGKLATNCIGNLGWG